VRCVAAVRCVATCYIRYLSKLKQTEFKPASFPGRNHYIISRVCSSGLHSPADKLIGDRLHELRGRLTRC